MKIRYILLCWGIIGLLFAGCGKTPYHFPVVIPFANEWVLRTDIPRPDAERIVKQFSEILPLYHEILPLDSKMKRHFTISIFNNIDDYLSYQKKVSLTRSRSGFYSFDRGETALVYNGVKNTVRTLYHEGFHAYVQERLIHPPQWLNEGLAEYAESLRDGFLFKLTTGGTEYRWVGTLMQLQKNNAIPSLKTIVDNDWPDKHNLTNAEYALSWSIVQFFKKSGDETRELEFENYLTLLYNKKEPKKAFYTVFKDPDQLDKEWRGFIKKLPVKKLLGF